jgi:hypothetical protein
MGYLRHTDARLQVTLDLRISLPQVAVVGSQSSGKSSVLEALVSTTNHPCLLSVRQLTESSSYTPSVDACYNSCGGISRTTAD